MNTLNKQINRSVNWKLNYKTMLATYGSKAASDIRKRP